jgi:hypothetical protein
VVKIQKNNKQANNNRISKFLKLIQEILALSNRKSYNNLKINLIKIKFNNNNFKLINNNN